MKNEILSITGPKADIDRMTETYLSKYEIHLENALSELTEVANLSPFLEINPYKEALSTIDSFYEQLEDPSQISPELMDIEKAIKTVQGGSRTDSDAWKKKSPDFSPSMQKYWTR